MAENKPDPMKESLKRRIDTAESMEVVSTEEELVIRIPRSKEERQRFVHAERKKQANGGGDCKEAGV